MDFGVKTPVVHEPLKWKFEAIEDGVGIDIDAGLVLLEDFGDDGGLFPRCPSVSKVVDCDVVILVSVNFSYRKAKLANVSY